MKLFHHYKNKAYTYRGLARHSETQEEMVVYETRYENSGGKLWVRPKGMFFENVKIKGQEIPRFRQVALEIREFTEITAAEIALLGGLTEKSFGQWDEKWFQSTFRNHRNFYLLLAFVEGAPVAFKLGYELSQEEFYSWLGGVVPEYRGLGIAVELMARQHDWCRRRGYRKVQTKSQNRFRDMLVLNLRHGFEITGYHQSNEGGPKVMLELAL